MKKKNLNIVKNIIALYGLSIAKIIFPLVTLPYLTRVLSVESYGVVSYVKSVMQYMQIIVDFGFMLSGTKDIVNVKGNKKKLEEVTSIILTAGVILTGIVLVIVLAMCAFIPILHQNAGYTLLSFFNVFLSIFLFEYLFRGLEKMEVITVRFVIMKGLSTILTFFMVHSDTDIYWIPVLDILGSMLAIAWVFSEINKMEMKISLGSVKSAFIKLRESAVYFLSNMATTAFGALNTFLIGIFLPTAEIAYWSVCMQLIGGIQSLYSPIINGIYPEMIKNPNLKLIKKFLAIFMPLVLIGCGLCVGLSEIVIEIVGGKQYIEAAPIFCMLIPVLIFSFPGMLLGWPTLGAVNKAKQVTNSTVISAVFQIVGLIILIVFQQFNLFTIAILRNATEFLLFLVRFGYVYRYKSCFRIYDY